jgi:Caspase domain
MSRLVSKLMFMRLSFFILCMILIQHLCSQTIYELKIKFNSGEEYDALLLLHTNDSGLIRMKKMQEPGVVFEMNIIQELPEPAGDETPIAKVVYKSLNSKTITGTGTGPGDFTITFKIENNETEPSSVSNGELVRVDFIKATDLTRSLVQKYFSVTDPLYTNLFVKTTRGLSPADKKVRIHLIIVANTNDSVLSEACRIDMERVQTTFQDVTDVLGISPMNVLKIDGNNYSKEKVLNGIKSLKAPFLDRNDIIVFYYTGHGFRLPGKTTAFPMMDLRSNYKQNYMDHYLTIDTVFGLIKDKGARMNLIISDCCNWNPGMQLPFVAPDVRARSSETEWDADKLKTLFLNTKRLSILGTAADRNQLAISNKTLGSFYFKFFSESLSSEVNKTNRNNVSISNWQTILENARNQTYKKSKRTYCSKPYISQNICNAMPIYIME